MGNDGDVGARCGPRLVDPALRRSELSDVDDLVVRLHERSRRPTPGLLELRRHTPDDPQAVHDRLGKAAESNDRRASAMLTGAAFMVALSGAPIAGGAENVAWYFPCTALSLLAFLGALRAITRRVDGHGLPAAWADVELGRDALAAKRAWSWLSARLLRVAVYWLFCLTFVLALLG